MGVTKAQAEAVKSLLVTPDDAGAQKAKVPTAECGVQLKWLEELAACLRGDGGERLSTADVVAKLILPLLAKLGRRCRCVASGTGPWVAAIAWSRWGGNTGRDASMDFHNYGTQP
jgi:hypothetical protein